ncbi:Protein FdhE [Fundidesulfovibrio magnetotacticus]|uniref:Protein FdhE n=1 Tax=Fundidesulfovibrio magnetotacticus TaxID=2730080 RepID=A0A6V8LLC1_9BACT|nr:formate dehydrogenase accessory protein FdhE [Fundidesulfovibrio magnetotacticus]GFK93472.1 Protein FdhE [Fundidesulfovibrio magnetotacticus]
MFETVDREKTLIRRKLAQMRKRPHLPAPLLDLAEKVLEMQLAARVEAAATVFAPGELTPVDQVIAGASLLPRERFPLEMDPAGRLFTDLAGALADLGGPAAQAAAMVLAEGSGFMENALRAYLAGDEAFFTEFSGRTPQAPRTLNFLAQCAVTPQATALAEALSLTLPQDRTWEQGSCPVCGSLAFQSALVGKEGVRHNACSFCRASYRTFRLQCPYCHERDATKLRFFVAEEEPGYRVDTCETCKGYIKTTDFREYDRPSLPALDDLESMTLDILAMRQGYLRPTPSALGF